MPEWALITALTLAAGAAMPVGGLLARIEHIHPDWLDTELRHSVIAFGGGALLSAVALVLVPEGVRSLSMGAVFLSFLGGGLAFLGLDLVLAVWKTSASQLAAMLSDFLPEAIAMGAAFSGEGNNGPGLLLAMLIALQNLPEGFNAYREMVSATRLTGVQVIASLAAAALLGPVAGLGGYFLLGNAPSVVAAIMLFAAGGILYLTFQDIAPQAKLEQRWAPPLGAVLGFMLGVMGHMMVG